MVDATLDAMAYGGMYDQIGGGFARYSTDESWFVPHFEKMLYDQALLVPVYADAWLVTRKPLYRRVVEETLDFVRRELTSPDGGFLASLDADSEGHEGRFYVWNPEEVAEVLGAEDGAFFCRVYGIASRGNFEEKSIRTSWEERSRRVRKLSASPKTGSTRGSPRCARRCSRRGSGAPARPPTTRC